MGFPSRLQRTARIARNDSRYAYRPAAFAAGRLMYASVRASELTQPQSADRDGMTCFLRETTPGRNTV